MIMAAGFNFRLNEQTSTKKLEVAGKNRVCSYWLVMLLVNCCCSIICSCCCQIKDHVSGRIGNNVLDNARYVMGWINCS